MWASRKCRRTSCRIDESNDQLDDKRQVSRQNTTILDTSSTFMENTIYWITRGRQNTQSHREDSQSETQSSTYFWLSNKLAPSCLYRTKGYPPYRSWTPTPIRAPNLVEVEQIDTKPEQKKTHRATLDSSSLFLGWERSFLVYLRVVSTMKTCITW